MEAEHSMRSRVGSVRFAELEASTGRELSLGDYLDLVRGTAQGVGAFDRIGSCLVTCADELQLELRERFEADVSKALGGAANGSAGAFLVANLGARVEPGVMGLVDDHFIASGPRESRLLVVLVSAHLGRRVQGGVPRYGVVERLGRESHCCGALHAALGVAGGAPGPNTTWLDELIHGFGPRRLGVLAGQDSKLAPVSLAVTHAVLQAEALLAELWASPPPADTTVLLATSVTVNGADGSSMLPVGCHLVRVADGGARVVGGRCLPTAPDALLLSESAGRLEVTADASELPATEDDSETLHASVVDDLRALCALADDEAAAVDEHSARCRAAFEQLRGDAQLRRLHARPLLRGFFLGLTGIAPGAAIAALLVPNGTAWPGAAGLARLRAAGSEPARALRDLGMRIQQLRHEDAGRVLEALLAGDGTPGGDRAP